jgi:opacity protein-like surface antigen
MRGGPRALSGTALLVSMLVFPTLARAQAASPPGAGIEVIAGFRFNGPVSLGTADASESRPGGGAFTLFTTSTTLGGATGVEAGVGFRLSRAVQLRVVGAYTVADVRTRIESDAEGIPDEVATEPVQQYAVEGTIAVDLDDYRIGERLVPFVSAGAGYLREVHDENTLA